MVYHYYDTSAILFFKEKFIKELINADKANICCIVEDEVFKTIETLIGTNRGTQIEEKYINLLSQLYCYDYLYSTFRWNKYKNYCENIKDIQDFYKIKDNELFVLTNELSTRNCYENIENNFMIEFVGNLPVEDTYTGYKEMHLVSETEINEFYEDIENNKNDLTYLRLKENEYMFVYDVRDNEHKLIDIFKWRNNKYERIIRNQRFNSDYFGEIKPKDEYQAAAMDSLMTNNVTLLGGVAGTGKTYLAMGYLFDQLQKHKIDRIILFCNPVGAKNAAKLGYYPGTMIEKILSTQIGNILISKIGDISEVERLIDEGSLQIVPTVDARGYEVPANSGVYIAEAQNLTSDLLRLILQRVGSENIKVIVDGDREEQLDMAIYEEDNGMRKMSKVFRGSPMFGQIDLKNIYRSEIAKLAQLMR